MKIAACLGVKDEVELILPCIAHLRTIGVDHVIVSDGGSTDGTVEAVRPLVGPDLDLVFFDDRNTDPDHEDRATANIIRLGRAAGADWMIFCDADEFPLPASGRLQLVEGLDDLDVLYLPRHNVPLLEMGVAMDVPPDLAALNQILLYAPNAARAETMTRVRKDPDLPWISGVPVPKILVNLATVDTTGEGHHVASAASGVTRSATASDLVVAHLPFTTEARFARKVANIESVLAEVGHLWGPNSAWHWRRWLDNVQARGGVAGEVARNRATAEELRELRRSGVVKTAAEVLALARAGGQAR